MAGSSADLPHVDEHAVVIRAPAEAVWASLGRVLSNSLAGRAVPVARLLGAKPSSPSGDPLRPGSALTGFRVISAEPHAELVLRGRHRFSEYELAFRLEALTGGRVLLRAETRALFPGRRGRAYRLAVIGTRGHVLAVDGFLQSTRRLAERAT